MPLSIDNLSPSPHAQQCPVAPSRNPDNKMFSPVLQSLAIALGLSAGTVFSQDAVRPLVSRRVTEYLMPVTAQTHEVARVPDTNFLLLSQMSNSQLVKIELDPATEAPVAYQSFPMGESSRSGLHGVWPSIVQPGMMWLSLQSENKLLLVDPGNRLSDSPLIIKTIDVPEPGNGPHSVFEIDNRVWAGLKVASEQTEKYYVFSADIDNPSDTILYPCLNSPVFIQKDPATNLVYVTQDTASAIMRIDTTTGETTQLPIPPSVGNNPVGLITASGPLTGLWFSLAGNSTGTLNCCL
jgi:virginiamycin B lyase